MGNAGRRRDEGEGGNKTRRKVKEGHGFKMTGNVREDKDS